jgi:hypothetical protein
LYWLSIHASTFFLSSSSSESLSVNVATKRLATSVDATTIPALEISSPTFLSSKSLPPPLRAYRKTTNKVLIRTLASAMAVASS